jgi:hypothetical protein
MTTDFPILAMPIPRAADTIGLKETALKALIKDGTIETILIGKRRLVLFDSMKKYIESRRGKPGDARRNPAEMDKGREAHLRARREAYEARHQEAAK